MMKSNRFLPLVFFFVAVFVCLVCLGGCSGKAIDEANPAELYKDAEEDISGERYILALDKLKNIKNKFPYSNYAVLAKLRIADVYYAQESFIEAAAAYEGFRDMHPKHEKADYVLFRLAESNYSQLPSSDDRDLTPGTRAIEYFNEFLALYPKSTYVPQVQEHLRTSKERLASKEKYVADFYFKRSQYDSASGRYKKITSQFADTSLAQEAYWYWIQSLFLDKKPDEAKHALEVYRSRFPSGAYLDNATQLLSGGTSP